MNPDSSSRTRPARRLTWAAAIGLTLLSTGALAQEVELYGQPGFGGSQISITSATPDLSPFNNWASSLVIRSGDWELCAETAYRGPCMRLGPGRYAALPPAMNNTLSSLRPIGGGDGVMPPVRPPVIDPPRPPGSGYEPLIVLYSGLYRDRQIQLNAEQRDLRSQGFNDLAVSIQVRSGEWELCTDAGFRGDCQRFGPGRAVLAGELARRVSSLRPVGIAVTPPGPAFPVDPGTRPPPGVRPAVILYENSGFSGRELPLAGPAPNLRPYGFNDRASSVEVFRGRWQFCDGADFSGYCITYGPGRYALGHALRDGISSVRPVFGSGDRPIDQDGAVTLHSRGDYGGRSVTINQDTRDLRAYGFDNQAVAVEVHLGQWELCSAAGFRGRCAVFGPGWHRLPDGLAGELSSLRPR